MLRHRTVHLLFILSLLLSLETKRFRTAVKILIFLFLLTSLVARADEAKLSIYVDNSYPPFSYLENDQLKGIYPEILRALQKGDNPLTFDIVPLPWQMGKRQLQQNKNAAMLGFYYQVKGHEFVQSYSVPVYKEEVVLICASEGAPNAASWPEDFRGKLVANVAGYSGWLRDNVRSDENTQYVNFLEVPDTSTALLMVLKGKLDCALFERHTYEFLLQQFLLAGRFDKRNDRHPFIAARISTEATYMGYSVALDECDKLDVCEFSKAFDQAIKTMKSNGRLADIIRLEMGEIKE